MSKQPAPNLIVPTGTQIVTRVETKSAPGQPPRPRAEIAEASQQSSLPEAPAAFDALEGWLVRVRLAMGAARG
jgi:hypothetical protein